MSTTTYLILAMGALLIGLGALASVMAAREARASGDAAKPACGDAAPRTV